MQELVSLDNTMPDKRATNGGARPGAGRPPEGTEAFYARLSIDTRRMLERFAKAEGIPRRQRKRYWDEVFQKLLSKVKVPEPAYLGLVAKPPEPQTTWPTAEELTRNLPRQ